MTTFILYTVGGLIVLIALAFFINKIPKKFHLIIATLLLAAIAFFGYNLYRSIADPVEFKKVKEARYKEVVEQLIHLRDAEGAHKTIVGRYTNDINKLAQFVDTAKFAITRQKDTTIADVEKNRRYGITGYYLEKTIVDTVGFKSVKDSLFKNVDVTKLLEYNIPNATGQIKLETGEYVDDENFISIFKATAKKSDILFDQDKRFVEQELKTQGVEDITGPEIIVGSLEEVTTSGNWPRQYASKKD